eukprot:TRINITY_DN2633_c0_g1_i2.p1 TRINITY_DN2633_c0_g1~~TRINITY_DN2633_c0_g1_i2.p1  ORF type:complete len:315 (-),score=77.64 TRINITY_DN2633_c0_g1_i2:188-1102(-)
MVKGTGACVCVLLILPLTLTVFLLNQKFSVEVHDHQSTTSSITSSSSSSSTSSTSSTSSASESASTVIRSWSQGFLEKKHLKFESVEESKMANRNPEDPADKSFFRLLPNMVDVEQLLAEEAKALESVKKGKFRKPRKILVDVGAAEYDTSLGWFRQHYPLTFDDIHAFDTEKDKLVVPASLGAEYFVSVRDHSPAEFGLYDAPPFCEDNCRVYNGSRWMKENLLPSDFVVMKIDVEGNEWKLIPFLIKENVFPLVDELFVGIHFDHPNMTKYTWQKFVPHTYQDAVNMFNTLRSITHVVHYWP